MYYNGNALYSTKKYQNNMKYIFLGNRTECVDG